jgi:beta-phosphoglucomutase-like phosphatase (HAD superfamily)
MKKMLFLLFFMFILFFQSSIVFTEITGAIFDMDGTLIDSMKMWPYVGETYLTKLGIKIDTDLNEDMCSCDAEGAVKYLKANYNLQIDDSKLFFDIEQIIELYYKDVVQLKPGVEKFITDMKKDNIPMVVATSASKKIASLALSKFGIIENFTSVLSCHEFKTYT